MPGATTYEVFVAGVPTSPFSTPFTSVVVNPAPAGTYIVQVRGRDGGTVGPLSAPVTIVVGGGAAPGCDAVGAPTVTVATAGMTVNVNWAAVPGAIGYRLQVGTSPGTTQFQRDFGAGETGFGSAIPFIGTFYLRVIAGNACGALAPSAEQAFTIGAATPGPAPTPSSGPRSPDPPPGQIIQRATLGYASAIINNMGSLYRGDLLNSCTSHTWLYRVVQALRQVDARWGLNYIRGHAPRMSEDVVAFNPTAGPDEGAQQIYLFDIISGHCTGNPQPWMNDVTDFTWFGGPARDWSICANQYCARWTLEPYIRAGVHP